MKLNKKIASVLTSTLLVFSMGGCQQQEEDKKTDNELEQKIEEQVEENVNKPIEEAYEELTDLELMEHEYILMMDLFDQVFEIMQNSTTVGAEKAKEQLMDLENRRTEPTHNFIKKYDEVLDKLVYLTYLYIESNEEGKQEILTYVNGVLQELKQLNKEFEKIMESAQEI